MMNYVFVAVVAVVAGFAAGYVTMAEEHYLYKSTIEAQQNELREENEKQRLVRERIDKDTANGWAAAVDYLRKHPRIVRVQSNCDSAGLRPIPSTTGITPKLPEQEPRFGSTGDVTVAVEECQQRLETAITDAAWIEHVKVWADNQSRIGK